MSRSVLSARRQLSTLVVWLLLGLAALPMALKVNDELEAQARLKGSESARVEVTLRARFESPFARIALLRVAGAPSPRSPSGKGLLMRVTDALKATPGVKGVISYLDREDTLFVGRDESAILIVGLDVDEPSGDAMMAGLRKTTDGLHAALAPDYPGVTFGWTGESAVNADLRRLSARETRMAEVRVLPITLVLLVVAFRSLVCALLPVLCGGLTILIALGIIAAVNRFWPASLVVVSIASMVGLGLSIDYALLIVSRYRDALRAGLERQAALAEAAEHGGRTVLVSGSAVAIGFAALLLVPVSEVRSIGMGGLVVTTVAVLVASTFLPVALAWLGPWIDVVPLRLWRWKTRFNWRGWAQWVSRHPVAILVGGGLPLVLLAAQAVHLSTHLPRGRWLPETADSVRVLHEIDSVAPGNFGQIVHAIVDLPPGTTIDREAGWRAVAKLVRHFARDPRIQHVWSITTVNVVPLGGPELLKKIPESVKKNFISADEQSVLIEILPRQHLTATDAAAMVREFRAANLTAITGLAGMRLELGGVPAFNVDYENAIKNSLGLVVLLVIGATLLVLSIAFRSALIPLKAVTLNLLSVIAAFGAVTLVFQDGYGSRLFGLPRPLDGGFPIVPVLVFCIVFGLSMDYEVFIVARIADGRRAGLSDREALIEGIANTGRVITFAAAIMMTVFGGFMFGQFVLVKILGFALGFAVLVDASLIRLWVGPALIQLAGRWNWWPGRQRLDQTRRLARGRLLP
jgi:putative drug exporter of the RND superfamily